MTGVRIPASLAARSHEIALRCAPDGRLLGADERAARRLSLAGVERFAELVVPGLEDLAGDLLRRGARGAVDGCELSLMIDGRPTTVRFVAEPDEGEVALLGLVLPRHFEDAIGQVSESMNEIVALNREISRQKAELAGQNLDLERKNVELSESHRGVLSLTGELRDKSVELERQAEIKARVVANVSHEFRTPLNAILGLTQLLLDQIDGPLTAEQFTQVRFIRSSSEELLALVNDVLDLTRVEAGKAALRATKIQVADLCSSLRGMLRPLVPADRPVELIVEQTAAAPAELHTDEAKLSQILRNLVSNALKFTERGSVRLIVDDAGDGMVRFTVVDTGIGIPPEHRDRIFEEFSQVDNPLQRPQAGTGLGLPIARKLAELLGGSLVLVPTSGPGSTFALELPIVHPEVAQMDSLVERSAKVPPNDASILVVEDDRKTLFVYDKFLTQAGFHVVPARSIDEARGFLARARPAAIVLDILLENESSWDFLAEVKRAPATADIPVLVVTVTNRAQKARALGADEFWLKPVDQDRLLRKLRSLGPAAALPKVLVIDDDERARYLIRSHLRNTPYSIIEASNAGQGVELAGSEKPDVILLDFLLEGSTAFDVIDELKAEPETRLIPIIIVTSQVLDGAERARLLVEAESVISKESLSRELALSRIRDALAKAAVHSRRRGS